MSGMSINSISTVSSNTSTLGYDSNEEPNYTINSNNTLISFSDAVNSAIDFSENASYSLVDKTLENRATVVIADENVKEAQ